MTASIQWTGNMLYQSQFCLIVWLSAEEKMARTSCDKDETESHNGAVILWYAGCSTAVVTGSQLHLLWSETRFAPRWFNLMFTQSPVLWGAFETSSFEAVTALCTASEPHSVRHFDGMPPVQRPALRRCNVNFTATAQFKSHPPQTCHPPLLPRAAHLPSQSLHKGPPCRARTKTNTLKQVQTSEAS